MVSKDILKSHYYIEIDTLLIWEDERHLSHLTINDSEIGTLLSLVRLSTYSYLNGNLVSGSNTIGRGRPKVVAKPPLELRWVFAHRDARTWQWRHRQTLIKVYNDVHECVVSHNYSPSYTSVYSTSPTHFITHSKFSANIIFCTNYPKKAFHWYFKM